MTADELERMALERGGKVTRVNLPAHESLPADMGELEFQDRVIELLRSLGYRVAHFRPARTAKGEWRTAVQADGKGFFDLVAVGRGRIIALELKAGDRVLTGEQEVWRDAWMAAGGSWGSFRPADWLCLKSFVGALQ